MIRGISNMYSKNVTLTFPQHSILELSVCDVYSWHIFRARVFKHDFQITMRYIQLVYLSTWALLRDFF